MKEKEPRFKPGDQVCTVHDVEGFDSDWISYLKVSKGRLGVVISFKEYWTDFERRYKRTFYAPSEIESQNKLFEYHYTNYKKGIENGRLCPVRFYRVKDKKDQIGNTADYIELVGEKDIAKLDFLDQKTVFIFEQLRVIFAEGDRPFQPDWGCKALAVDFMFENRSTEVLRLTPSLRIWLTYINPGRTSQKSVRVEPIHIDLSDGNLAGGARLSGQVIFHVPGNTGNYGFHLELPNVGTVEKVIDLPNLQPGDKVRLKRSTRNVSAADSYNLPFHKRLYIWLTKDSIGTIVSFSQYRKYLNQLKQNNGISQSDGELPPEDQELHERFLGLIKIRIEIQGSFSDGGYAYLVRLEKVNRPSGEHYPDEEEYARLLKEHPNRQEPPVEEGEIVYVSSLDLEKVE
ncbi:MAG: hypothetical protein HY865_09325 [Chloroflexi bacterium]|nr:hypothetical protein [Chloroflexota bacterium]